MIFPTTFPSFALLSFPPGASAVADLSFPEPSPDSRAMSTSSNLTIRYTPPPRKVKVRCKISYTRTILPSTNLFLGRCRFSIAESILLSALPQFNCGKKTCTGVQLLHSFRREQRNNGMHCSRIMRHYERTSALSHRSTFPSFQNSALHPES